VLHSPRPARLVTLSCSLAFILIVEFVEPAHTRSESLIQKEQLSAEQHIERARDALQKKDYRMVKDEAKRALSLNKNLPETYLLLAIALRHQGELSDAKKYVEQALSRKPDYADAHFILGLIQFQKKNYVAASTEASTAIAQGASFPNVYVLLAQAALARNKSKEAVDAFEKALRLNPNPDEATQIKQQVEALNGWLSFQAVRHDPSYARPVPLNAPQPAYTVEAREARVEGACRLAVLVNEDGKVTSSLVFLSIGFGLDEQAVKAAQSLRFKPAMKDGKPISFWQMVIVEFNLGRR
jgi:TonB family protein